MPVEIAGPDLAEYARYKISGLEDYLREPVLHTRVRLTYHPNPAMEDRSVLAQANLVLRRGRMVRAQLAARTGREAVDLLRDRLEEQLRRRALHWEARRGAQPSPEPGEWRHGQPPTQRPSFFPRPVEEREIIRHKSFTPARISPEEAAWEIDQFDYGFHLFTDLETDQDAVICRGGATGLQLQRLRGNGPPPPPGIALEADPTPELSLEQARQRLEFAGLPFVFFTDAATGRGRVLYHRYDGHYGLITPQ